MTTRADAIIALAPKSLSGKLTANEVIARWRAGYLDPARPTALEIETAISIRRSNEKLRQAFVEAFGS